MNLVSGSPAAKLFSPSLHPSMSRTVEGYIGCSSITIAHFLASFPTMLCFMHLHALDLVFPLSWHAIFVSMFFLYLTHFFSSLKIQVEHHLLRVSFLDVTRGVRSPSSCPLHCTLYLLIIAFLTLILPTSLPSKNDPRTILLIFVPEHLEQFQLKTHFKSIYWGDTGVPLRVLLRHFFLQVTPGYLLLSSKYPSTKTHHHCCTGLLWAQL